MGTCARKILLSALSCNLSYIFVEDKVNHNRRTTSEKKKDVNLSNESSSDVPQPKTNGEKAAARVGTTSCQQQLCMLNR